MHLQVFFFSPPLPAPPSPSPAALSFNSTSQRWLSHQASVQFNPSHALNQQFRHPKMSLLLPLSPPFPAVTPSVPLCSRPRKQLKQFSCRELLSLIAMKDTFSHHSLGEFFSHPRLFPSVSLSLRLAGSVGAATERGLSERGHNYILQYARRWQGFYAS